MKLSSKSYFESSILYYLLISLTCLNLLGRGSLMCLVFALFALLKSPPIIKIDTNFFFAFLLTISVSFSSAVFYDIGEVVKGFNYVLLYVIGYSGFSVSTNKKKYIERTTFAIFVGFAFYIAITYFYNLDKISFSTEDQRLLYNVWTGSVIAVTLVGLLSSVVIGYSFYAIFIQKNYWLRILGVVALIFAFLINIQTATRTPFILLAIVYSILFLIRLFDKKSKKSFIKLGKYIFLIILLVVIYESDFAGIKTYILSSPIVERFMEEGTETERWEISVHYLNKLLDYPWGGNRIFQSLGRSAHTFILEGHDKYGIFALVATLGISVECIINTVKLVLVKGKKHIDYLLIALYMSIIIQINLEPVFNGYPVVIMFLLMIHGLATAYLSNREVVVDGE